MSHHPDGVSHAHLPMANVHKTTHNIQLPLPGIVRSAKPTSYHIPEMSHIVHATPALHMPKAELHQMGTHVPKTKSIYGMIALEKR
jgi:hypothetical protein